YVPDQIPGLPAIDAAEELGIGPPLVERCYDNRARILRIDRQPAEAVPAVERRSRRCDVGPGSRTGVVFLDVACRAVIGAGVIVVAEIEDVGGCEFAVVRHPSGWLSGNWGPRLTAIAAVPEAVCRVSHAHINILRDLAMADVDRRARIKSYPH